jgi:hypothetical protein
LAKTTALRKTRIADRHTVPPLLQIKNNTGDDKSGPGAEAILIFFAEVGTFLCAEKILAENAGFT